MTFYTGKMYMESGFLTEMFLPAKVLIEFFIATFLRQFIKYSIRYKYIERTE